MTTKYVEKERAIWSNNMGALKTSQLNLLLLVQPPFNSGSVAQELLGNKVTVEGFWKDYNKVSQKRFYKEQVIKKFKQNLQGYDWFKRCATGQEGERQRERERERVRVLTRIVINDI